MAASVSLDRIVLDPRAVAEVLRGPQGPVLRYAMTVGQRVKAGAKARVGVKTGKLRDSIVTRLVAGGIGGADVVVGSNVAYAGFHHEGTKPHVIMARNARVLVFDAGGTTVFTSRVNHPGTRPNRFLTDAARAEGLKVRLMRGGF